MSAYLDAHNNADLAISDLSGLAFALYDLSNEASCIDHTDPAANAIMALIRTLEAKSKAMEDLQQRAWDAYRAECPPKPSAAA